jgi:hypothetical protein
MLKILALSIVTLFFTVNSYADVQFEMEQKEMSPESVGQIKGKVKDDNLRMDFFENGNQLKGSMIYRGDLKEIIMINHDDKTYLVLDQATMNALAKQFEQAMSQMEEAMKKMPPDQREKMKEMMKEKMPGAYGGGGTYVEPELKKAGTGSVDGISCTKYDVFRGDEKVRQHCVANWNNIQGGEEMMTVMLQMADFMDQMAKSFSKAGNFVGEQAQFERGVFNQLRQLNGFPIQTIEYDKGKVRAESNFISSEKSSITTADLEPPAGYTQQKTPVPVR